MKRNGWMLVILSAIAGGLLAAAGQGVAEATGRDFWSAPFLLAGRGLRALALAGSWGGAAAWGVTALVCVLPLGALGLWRRRRGGWKGEDLLAGLAAPVLFCLIYHAINPTLLPGLLGEIYPAAAAGCLLSMGVAWLALKLVRWIELCPPERLGEACRPLLVGGAALTAFSGAYTHLADALIRGREVAESNTADPEGAGFTGVVLVALALLELAPYLMGALALLWGAELAGAMGEGFSPETVALCERTALGCKFLVQSSVVLILCTNLTQLALMGRLYSTRFAVYIPLFPLLLAAGLSLLCRVVRRGRELQADSDSII